MRKLLNIIIVLAMLLSVAQCAVLAEETYEPVSIYSLYGTFVLQQARIVEEVVNEHSVRCLEVRVKPGSMVTVETAGTVSCCMNEASSGSLRSVNTGTYVIDSWFEPMEQPLASEQTVKPYDYLSFTGYQTADGYEQYSVDSGSILNFYVRLDTEADAPAGESGSQPPQGGSADQGTGSGTASENETSEGNGTAGSGTDGESGTAVGNGTSQENGNGNSGESAAGETTGSGSDFSQSESGSGTSAEPEGGTESGGAESVSGTAPNESETSTGSGSENSQGSSSESASGNNQDNSSENSQGSSSENSLGNGSGNSQESGAGSGNSSSPESGATVVIPDVLLSPQRLMVDGVFKDVEKYNIRGNNYFKLRDLAYMLNGTGSQFSVGYDNATETVSIVTGQPYLSIGGELVIGTDKSSTAQATSQTILINGERRNDLTVYNLGGNNFFRLRDLGMALNFEVGYDEATNVASIVSRRLPPQSAMNSDGVFESGALFIGDGVTANFIESYLKPNKLLGKAKYMAIGSMSMYHFFDDYFILGEGNAVTYGNIYSHDFNGMNFADAAEWEGEDAKAIYFMLGTNFASEATVEQYTKITDHLLKVCPNAVIYLQTIPSSRSMVQYTTANKSIEETVENYKAAGETRVRLLDTCAAIGGKSLGGNGISLTLDGMEAWYQCLLDNSKG